MTNNEFWSSVSAIISNGFNNEDLVKLENYAEQFINRQLLFERYTQGEQYGCAEGGRLHVIVTILAGAETPADKLTAPRGSFKRECQRAEAQAAVLESWAKAAGCWVDDIDVAFEKSFGKQLAEGGEAHVYDNGTTIVKRIGLDYYILPELALDRITLHNTLFPETKLVVLGLGRTSDGNFQIIVQQTFIHGTSLTDEEICNYVESLGFKLINPRNWTYATSSIYLSDMHNENLIKSPGGNVFVIDCDVRINTAELKCNGTRQLTNHVRFIESAFENP